MGTHSRIGIKLDDGNVKHIYCHWDGYVSNNGAILFEHYKDKEKVEKLIDLGDISSLREEVDIPEGKEHSFEHSLENVTIAYGRDRGETDVEPKISTEDDFWRDYIEEYGYLYDNGKWYVETSHGKYDEETDEYVEVDYKDRKKVELTEDVIKKETDKEDSCLF